MGKQKHLSMAYRLSNKFVKNCCKRTIVVQLFVDDMIMFFGETVVCKFASVKMVELNGVTRCRCPAHSQLYSARRTSSPGFTVFFDRNPLNLLSVTNSSL